MSAHALPAPIASTGQLCADKSLAFSIGYGQSNNPCFEVDTEPQGEGVAPSGTMRICEKDIRPEGAPRRGTYQPLARFPFHSSRAIFRAVGSLRHRAASSAVAIAEETERRST